VFKLSKEKTKQKTQPESKPTQAQPQAKKRDIPIIAGFPTRPSKESKSEESGSAHVSKALAPQLGSNPRKLAAMEIDERKMAVLDPYVATSLGYFDYRGVVGKIRFWNRLVDWELVTSQAIDGLARRQILQAIANSSGVQISEVVKAPNVLARNIWSRDWKKKAELQGKVTED
jgi:hypothetical protein